MTESFLLDLHHCVVGGQQTVQVRRVAGDADRGVEHVGHAGVDVLHDLDEEREQEDHDGDHDGADAERDPPHRELLGRVAEDGGSEDGHDITPRGRRGPPDRL